MVEQQLDGDIAVADIILPGPHEVYTLLETLIFDTDRNCGGIQGCRGVVRIVSIDIDRIRRYVDFLAWSKQTVSAAVCLIIGAVIESIEQVIVCGRIMGSLAVARAFGDFEYKSNDKLFVSVEPHVAAHPLHPNDQFLILACDGLWDTVTYRDAVVIANKLRGEGKQPEEVADYLAKLALERGSQDNVTVIIVYINWGKSAQKSAPAASSSTKKEPVEESSGGLLKSYS